MSTASSIKSINAVIENAEDGNFVLYIAAINIKTIVTMG